MKLITVLLLTLSLNLSFANANQIKVAIVDGVPDTEMLYDKGIPLCKPYPSIKVSNPDMYVRHGTNIALMVMKDVSYNKGCLLYYPMNVPSKAIRQAVDDGASFINLSIGGEVVNPIEARAERLAILYALVRGVKVVIAAGNEGIELTPEVCKTRNLIGCYAFIPSWNKYLNKNLFYVGHTHKIGTELVKKGSNTFVGATYVNVSCSKEGYYHCGTSQSAAYYTNKLILKKENM